VENLRRVILKMINECRDEMDVDCRAEILHRINSLLPKSRQIKIPSLITNDYISMALYKIEESLLVPA